MDTLVARAFTYLPPGSALTGAPLPFQVSLTLSCQASWMCFLLPLPCLPSPSPWSIRIGFSAREGSSSSLPHDVGWDDESRCPFSSFNDFPSHWKKSSWLCPSTCPHCRGKRERRNEFQLDFSALVRSAPCLPNNSTMVTATSKLMN